MHVNNTASGESKAGVNVLSTSKIYRLVLFVRGKAMLLYSKWKTNVVSWLMFIGSFPVSLIMIVSKSKYHKILITYLFNRTSEQHYGLLAALLLLFMLFTALGLMVMCLKRDSIFHSEIFNRSSLIMSGYSFKETTSEGVFPFLFSHSWDAFVLTYCRLNRRTLIALPPSESLKNDIHCATIYFKWFKLFKWGSSVIDWLLPAIMFY